jgi:hypothetical protein
MVVGDHVVLDQRVRVGLQAPGAALVGEVATDLVPAHHDLHVRVDVDAGAARRPVALDQVALDEDSRVRHVDAAARGAGEAVGHDLVADDLRGRALGAVEAGAEVRAVVLHDVADHERRAAEQRHAAAGAAAEAALDHVVGDRRRAAVAVDARAEIREDAVAAAQREAAEQRGAALAAVEGHDAAQAPRVDDGRRGAGARAQLDVLAQEVEALEVRARLDEDLVARRGGIQSRLDVAERRGRRAGARAGRGRVHVPGRRRRGARDEERRSTAQRCAAGPWRISE